MPGMYKVRVEAKGFKTSGRTVIQVVVASEAQIDFELQTGQASETITVTGQAPLINTTSSSLGGTLSNKEISDLPLNGRNYENLLQLRPGVVRYPGGRILDHQRQRTACRRQCLYRGWSLQQRAFLRPEHYQWSRHRGRLRNDFARRRHPGIHANRKSAGGVWLEAWCHGQRGAQIRHE